MFGSMTATGERVAKRGLLLAAVLALACLAFAGTAGAATRTSLRGTFEIHFPKGHEASNAPCPADEFCGVGSLAGYGAATITIFDETFAEIPGSACFALTRVEQVDLLDGRGALVIESDGTFCRPGGSGDSHAGPSSYGGPGRWVLAFRVDGADSTGVFAGASGHGTETMGANGGVGVWHLDGSLGS
jgi:hypothetical protein